MGRGITVLIVLLCLTLGAFAAAPDSLWSVRVGGDSHDVCYAVSGTNDGGYVLAGWTKSSEFHATWYDVWLVKLNSAGDTVWTRTYGGPEGEGCFAIQQTSDGGFILAGMTGSFGEGHDGPSDGWAVRTNANGDTLWTKKYGGALSEGFYAVQATTDGGFAFAGFTDSYGTGNRDFWLVKTDANGDSLWSHTYGGPSFDECHAMVTTPDGGYALAGVTESMGNHDQNFYLVKTDGNGAQQWANFFGTAQDDNCYGLAMALNGGFALAGSSPDANTGQENFYLMRTDANGDSLWAKAYGFGIAGVGRDLCYAIQATQDSSFVLAGITNSIGSGMWDYVMMKADPLGNLVYKRSFGGSERDYAYALAKTSDGGFLIGGSTRSFNAEYDDVWGVKTGPDVLITPPGAFSLDSPADGITFIDTTYSIPFDWHKSANHDDYDSLRYLLFISDTVSFDTGRTDTSSFLSDTSFTWTRVITANRTHYWKVEAVDMGGWVTWSTDTRTFTVQGNAPGPFDLVYPANNAAVTDSFSLNFQWTAPADVDPNDRQTYLIFLSTDSTFASFDTMLALGVTHVEWTKLIPANQRNFWKVVATDRHGLSTRSTQVWSFTLVANAPAPFTLISPVNGDSIPDNRTFQFQWHAAADADVGDTVQYIVYCDSLSDFSSAIDSVDAATDTVVQWVRSLPATRTYYWKVKAYDKHSLVTWSDTWTFVRTPHSGAPAPIQDPGTPTVFKVRQNYPNPFNATTDISYDLPRAGWVTVKVFNILGREVETLVNQPMAAGSWRVTFDGTNLPSGVYMLRVEAPGVSELKKMMLLK